MRYPKLASGICVMSPSRVATGTTTHNWVLLCDVEIILNCGCQCVSFTWTDNIAANNPKNRESVLWHHISSKKKKKVKPWATKSQRCDFFFMPISSSELAEKEYFQCTVLSLPWVDTRGIKHSWAPAGLITAKLSFFLVYQRILSVFSSLTWPSDTCYT